MKQEVVGTQTSYVVFLFCGSAEKECKNRCCKAQDGVQSQGIGIVVCPRQQWPGVLRAGHKLPMPQASGDIRRPKPSPQFLGRGPGARFSRCAARPFSGRAQRRVGRCIAHADLPGRRVEPANRLCCPSLPCPCPSPAALNSPHGFMPSPRCRARTKQRAAADSGLWRSAPLSRGKPIEQPVRSRPNVLAQRIRLPLPSALCPIEQGGCRMGWARPVAYATDTLNPWFTVSPCPLPG